MIGAALTGHVRRQFYSDVFHFSSAPDASRQVAAGYICLGAAVGILAGAISTALLNPAHVEALTLAVINFCACLIGFRRLKWRRDPRPAIDLILVSCLLTEIVFVYRNAGVIAPVLLSLPAQIGIAVFFQRRQMRPVTAILVLATVAIAIPAALGQIGVATMYTQANYVLRVFVVLFLTTLGLGFIAWIAIVSRDYLLDQARQTNDAIVDSAARARLALEAARVGLWDVPDFDRRQFEVSESFESVTGYTGAEFSTIFGNAPAFFHPDDIIPMRDAFAAGRADGTRIRTEFRLRTKSRGYRWFALRALYSENPDGTTRVAGSLQDINFIKVAEEALRTGRDQARAANKAKSDFIAVMSHEVRTPLNAILGSVELLKSRLGHGDEREMVDLIDEAGRGLLAIVNDLLDLSRIDAGKLEITPAPTDIATLVGRSVEFWTPQASAKGLSLSIDCSRVEHRHLMLDPGRLRQIVSNLVSNAIKFTETGSIKTIVSTRELPDGRREAVISVIDTGPGVPEDVAEAIFCAFEQGPGMSSRGGAGLGLYISRRLATMMGGELTLERGRKDGAHFRVSLIAPGPADPATEGEPHAPAGAGRADYHVLCVDDNERNRRIVELLLGQLGFAVTQAASGAEAQDICALQRFDLILMDIVMPDLDGIQSLAEIRGDADGLNRTTPCIALTARLSLDDVETYRQAGFDGISGKPVDVASLAREISRVLSDQRAPVTG